jgi:parallel beta-helix repeat protein
MNYNIFERGIMLKNSYLPNLSRHQSFKSKPTIVLNLLLVLVMITPLINFNEPLGGIGDFFGGEDYQIDKSLDHAEITNSIPGHLGTLAQINVGPGNISGLQTWTPSNNYVIQGNITINGTLMIQPGVVVEVNGKYSIYVNGSLIIFGIKNNEVQIKPISADPQAGDWNGIRVNESGHGSIEFAVITYSTTGVYLDSTDNFTIKSTEIRHASSSAVVCDSTSNITIENNSFSYNNNEAVRLTSANNTTVQYNTLNANLKGIHITNSFNNSMIHNSIVSKSTNAFDDSNNTWHHNYFHDYSGMDKDGDNVGDTLIPYLIPGGLNNDTYPRTKIYHHDTLEGFANIAQAVKNSTVFSNIILRSTTPNAGSQTIDQEGYYYENVKIDSNLGHGVKIFGPISEPKEVIIDSDGGYGFEVFGNFNLTLINVTIINSEIGVFLHNGSKNSNLLYLKVHDNNKGIVLDSAQDTFIANSTIRDNYGSNSLGGLYVSSCLKIKIENNNFIKNLYGVTLFNTSNSILVNNNINSNYESGLRLNQSSFNDIVHNKMNSNDIYGLNISASSDFNTFYNNSYQNNEYAMELINSKFNRFTDSKILANIIGIYFDHGADNNTFSAIGPGGFGGPPQKAIESNRSKNNRFINCSILSMNIWLDKNSTMTFLNNIFTDNVVIWDNLSYLTVMNYLSVRVLNQSGIPVQPANVEIIDNNLQTIIKQDTDTSGNLSLVECVSYIQNQTFKDHSMNPHTIVANDTITNQTFFINITGKILKIIAFNYFPSIETTDVKTATERMVYSVQYNASTNEKDQSLFWEFNTNSTDWLEFNITTQTLSGTPLNRDVGRPWVNISVRDIDGDSAFHNFTINIQNRRPEILTQNVFTVREDEEYYVDYNSSDDDGYLNETGVLIFPAENFTTWSFLTDASEWLKFDNESGILSGTPNNNDVRAEPYQVYIFVFDGHGSKNTTFFELEVVNVPPEILGVDLIYAFKNKEYHNDYNSSDDGQGDVTWELDTNADWLNIDKTTGWINGTPRQGDVGDWWVNISVTDNHGGRSNRNFTISVIDLNVPPEILTSNKQTAYTDVEYYVQYTATDPDSPIDSLIWELSDDLAESNASWLTMDPKTGILIGTPLTRHIGWYWVTVRVFDPAGGWDSTTFRLDVLQTPNRPPELLTVLKEITKNSNDQWYKQFKAVDDYTPEDKLNWSLRSNADWLTINSSSGEIDVQFDQTRVGEFWVNVTVADEKGQINFTNFTLIVFSDNNAPFLSNAGITPEAGDVDTIFTFYVTYKDKDNDSGIVKVVVDGEDYVMKPNPSDNTNFKKGVNFTLELKLSKGTHGYYFTAEDKWGLEAKYREGVPSQNFPKKTAEIEEIVEEALIDEPMFWIIVLVIILVIMVLVLMIARPEQFNPVVRARVLLERERTGEFGYLCPVCKTILPKDSKECEKCGESFLVEEFLCPECDSTVKAKDAFCPNCGAKFEELEFEEEPEYEFEPEDEAEVDRVDSDIEEFEELEEFESDEIPASEDLEAEEPDIEEDSDVEIEEEVEDETGEDEKDVEDMDTGVEDEELEEVGSAGEGKAKKQKKKKKKTKIKKDKGSKEIKLAKPVK